MASASPIPLATIAEEAKVKKRKLSGDDFEQVLGTVREYVFQNHRFPQINDIV
ncbi:unnamed protein product, partial [marine sediment metagenome]